MIRFRDILAVGVITAATVALAAAPAQADSVSRYAHAHFDGEGGSMFVDVTRPAVGATVVDVEWQRSVCGTTDGVYACDSVHRVAYDVPVTRFSFSLTGAKLTATVPYQERQRHCEVINEDEVCDGWQESTGSTTLKVTWAALDEPLRRERWTGEDGTVHITTSAWTTVSGSGFGSSYDDPASSFGQLSRSRSIPPAA
ncbi:hypothetical protein ABZ780_25965 [Micromonospora sp. NPDC047467]|uniref:hypothetical protein n=1 Tax=Micromonospora sp. NPDC047467 TaxID=3154814 RepID=UPI00340AE9A6